MASSASAVSPSPAHSYHNRFIKEKVDTPVQPPAQAFDFNFPDFQGFDNGVQGGFGSFSAYQPHNNPEARNQHASQSPQASIQIHSSSYDHPSKDVAALEEVVAQEEDQRESFPPTSSRSLLPEPPMMYSPQESRLRAQDESSNAKSQQPPLGASESVKSSSAAAIGNFSRPNVASASRSTHDGSTSHAGTGALEHDVDAIDINSNNTSTTNAASNASAATNDSSDPSSTVGTSQAGMPPLPFIQAQQPVISGAADASNVLAQVFSPNEGGETMAAVTVEERERPNSFFGMERPLAAVNAAGQSVANPEAYNAAGIPQPPSSNDDASFAIFGNASDHSGIDAQARPREQQQASTEPRPSSFFFQGNVGDEPALSGAEPSQAARIAAYHRAETGGQAQLSASSSAILSPTGSTNRSTLAGGTGNAVIQQSASFNLGTSSGRPASIAPSVNIGPLLDHSHLKPGQQAALLSHNKTLELYRQNAKKTNDPDLIYEFAVFMVDASKSMSESPTGANTPGSKDEVIKEATGLLKKIAERGHPDSQYFLADCYANGIGTPKNKQDFDRAYPLFVLAAKHGHPDAAYRAGTCYEKGWGCRRDSGKALQFYRKAASMSHPGAMYRLATAELNGELGLKRSAKEGVKWLKRSADAATPEFPHALHELALLHERGIDNVLFVDPEYACELLAQAGEMGYAPSAYKLGVNYEYGRMGCPQDAGLSIHMYNIAAQQNHKEACFALTAWYLVGAPSILPQSDTEAYLWAKKAAEQELAKAEYAVGYFTEMGIGTVKDLKEAKEWYKRAAEHGDKRANQRLASLGGRLVQSLTGIGVGAANGKDAGKAGKAEQHERAPASADYCSLPTGARTQPTNAPFPSRVEVSCMSPNAVGAGTMFPSPMAMRDQQSAQREERYLANVAATQQAQYRASMAANGASQPARPPSRPSSTAPRAGSPAESPAMPPVVNYGQPPRPFANGSGQQLLRASPVSGGPLTFPHRTATPPTAPSNGLGSSSAPGPPGPFRQSSGPAPWSQQQQPPGPSQQASYPHMPAYASGPFPATGFPDYSLAPAYPSYPASASSGPMSAAVRPLRINTSVPGQPHPPVMNPPNAVAQSWVPSPQNRNGGQSQSFGGAAAGGMPYGLESDDATAAQIYARAQQQTANGASAEQPKKKKGWFSKS